MNTDLYQDLLSLNAVEVTEANAAAFVVHKYRDLEPEELILDAFKCSREARNGLNAEAYHWFKGVVELLELTA